MAYATIEDVEAALGKTFNDTEVKQAEFLLEVASSKLDKAIERYQIDKEQKAAQIEQVCALMVADVMKTPYGMESYTMQAGEFRETTTYSAKASLSVKNYLDVLGVTEGRSIGTLYPIGLMSDENSEVTS